VSAAGPIAAAVGRALGRRVTAARQVAGGDINEAWAVRLDAGEVAFLKTRADAAPGEFATEAAGLAWLAEAGARVPEVLGGSVLVVRGFGSVGSGVLEVQGLVLARPGSNTTQLLLCSVVRWTLRPGWFKPGRARCSGPALVVDRFRSDAGPRFPPWLVC